VKTVESSRSYFLLLWCSRRSLSLQHHTRFARLLYLRSAVARVRWRHWAGTRGHDNQSSETP